MERVWRRHGLARLLSAPALRLAAAAGMLFPETGANIPFSLRHSLGTGTEGRAEMTWRRTFRFPNAVRSFSATMFYDSGRGCIVDLLGQTGTLEVDLFPFIDASGAVCLSSGRQYLRFGPVAVPVPRLLAGTAHAREWVCEDGRLGIEVVVKNPLLGGFFGYHGSLVHVPCD